jgi:transposase
VKAPTPNELVSFDLPLTREQAEAIYAQGPEATIFVLMALGARVAELTQAQSSTTPSTPSGMVPLYEKPTVSKRAKTPGAKPGHPGTCRKPPPEITHHEEHPPLKCCPDCGSPLPPPSERRFRLIEEIPETHPEVTEHRIPRHWCPTCRKLVEPPVPDALPGATFGHRLVALTAWLHYGLGTTLSQILAVLQHHVHFRLSEGGLVDAWQRVAHLLRPWYEEIADEVKQSGTLHADETGWRVAGRTVWLWCFTTVRATYYMIDRCRGSTALLKFFTEEFAGVLVTDFWAAYNVVAAAARQACLVHLFRELQKVDDLDSSETWAAFRKKLKRLLGDAIRLGAQRQALPQETFASRRALLDTRRDELLATPWPNAHAKRLLKRLRRYRNALFTFLDHPGVPSDNNHAEREIRPAVIIRKNSLCNRSDNGAAVQAILMSVYRTLKLRGLDPLDTIVSALRDYVRTRSLPPLPGPNTSGA